MLRIQVVDQADRLACKAAIASGLYLRRSEVLRSLRHFLQDCFSFYIAKQPLPSKVTARQHMQLFSQIQ